MKKIASTILIAPWLYLLGIGILVLRFNLKYNAFPQQMPIDPKKIGMPLNVAIIDVLLLLTLLSVPIILYFIFYSFKNKHKIYKFLSIVGLVGLSAVFYLFKYTTIMDWYFD